MTAQRLRCTLSSCFFLLATVSLSATAQTRENERYLATLDSMLSHADHYVQVRRSEMQQLRRRLRQATTPREQSDLYEQLSDKCLSFSNDTALSLMRQSVETAERTGDKRLTALRRMKLIELYCYAQNLMEAHELFRELPPPLTSDTTDYGQHYATAGWVLYSCLSIASRDHRNQLRYDSLARHYAPLASAPDMMLDFARRPIQLMQEGRAEAAIQLLHREVRDGETTDKAQTVYGLLADAYRQLGDREQMLKYQILGSIAGVANADKQYQYLRELAMTLFEEGDLDRAYRYIRICVGDNNAPNAKLDMTELTQMVNTIYDAHAKRQQANQRRTLLFCLAIALIALFLLCALLALRRKNRTLIATRRQLQAANADLSLANRVKEAYVTQFMNLCVDYLDMMENHRKQLSKIAKRRNADEMIEALKPTGIIRAEAKDFYHIFDNAFLDIFPNFIEAFNKLLRPEEQIARRDRLSTDLRIYALLRLGISESGSIARFLRCSATTIYNARSKMRNRAINRDTFERDVCAIS